MKELTPPVRVARADIELLPLLHQYQARPFAPRVGRVWALLELEAGDTPEAWQAGRRIWVDMPADFDVAGLCRTCPRPQTTCVDCQRARQLEVAAVTAEDAVLAERALLWRAQRFTVDVPDLGLALDRLLAADKARGGRPDAGWWAALVDLLVAAASIRRRDAQEGP